LTIHDLGSNYIGDDAYAGPCIGPTTRIGTVAAPLDPMLGPLAQNGGGLPTHAPLQNSPVIGWGCKLGTIADERGAPRPYGPPANGTSGDGSDVGAFEFGSPPMGLGIGGTNAVVTWPAYYGDFILQSASNPAGPAAWSTVPDTPVVVGDQFVVSNSIVAPARFYRLLQR
jgi:hypothetical protein